MEFGDGRVIEWTELLAGGFLVEAISPSATFSTHYNSLIIGHDGRDDLRGGDGHDRLYGKSGDDNLSGGAGDDLLAGEAGNDTLRGGAGHDVFVFGRGYGHDLVYAVDNTPGRRDIVRLADLGPEEVEFGFQRNGLSNYHLLITIKNTGETMTVHGGLSSRPDYWIQAVEFGDGTVWEMAEILARGLTATDGDDALTLYAGSGIDGGPGNDTVNGSAFADNLYGGEGDDNLHGNSGDDILEGGAGNDSLTGGAGDDILKGGAGHDSLSGGAGDDTYIFRAGDGRDTIRNQGGGSDLLKFEDLNPAELWFGKSGNHLLIGLVGYSDQVTVNNWYAGDYKIDAIEAGESAVVESQVALLVQAMAAFGAPAGVGGGWTEEQREALNPILASYWQPK